MQVLENLKIKEKVYILHSRICGNRFRFVVLQDDERGPRSGDCRAYQGGLRD